ncbi:receptor tyrosine-protein kinase erbB-3-like isoform X1 [Sesbania bispinosa]|nr:receptor tyrosine-protein kinase erbB-3-like isoform X1 [Sesbania bispinosa]
MDNRINPTIQKFDIEKIAIISSPEHYDRVTNDKEEPPDINHNMEAENSDMDETSDEEIDDGFMVDTAPLHNQ